MPIDADIPEAEVPSPTSSLGLINHDSFMDSNIQAKQKEVFVSIEEGDLETYEENDIESVINEDDENNVSEVIGKNEKPFNSIDNDAVDDAKPEETDSPGIESQVSHDEEQGFGKKSCDSKEKELFNFEKVYDIVTMRSTVIHYGNSSYLSTAQILPLDAH